MPLKFLQSIKIHLFALSFVGYIAIFANVFVSEHNFLLDIKISTNCVEKLSQKLLSRILIHMFLLIILLNVFTILLNGDETFYVSNFGDDSSGCTNISTPCRTWMGLTSMLNGNNKIIILENTTLNVFSEWLLEPGQSGDYEFIGESQITSTIFINDNETLNNVTNYTANSVTSSMIRIQNSDYGNLTTDYNGTFSFDNLFFTQMNQTRSGYFIIFMNYGGNNFSMTNCIFYNTFVDDELSSEISLPTVIGMVGTRHIGLPVNDVYFENVIFKNDVFNNDSRSDFEYSAIGSGMCQSINA